MDNLIFAKKTLARYTVSSYLETVLHTHASCTDNYTLDLIVRIKKRSFIMDVIT